MPNKIVTVRRWELIAAFVFPIALAFGVAVLNSYRIHQAEKRIVTNQAINQRQNVRRQELVRELRATDARACERIEDLKIQNRLDALGTFSRLDQTLGVLHLARTPEIVRIARAELARDLKRNKPSNC